MKKLISTILFLFLTAPLCFCFSDFHFSFAPTFSFTYGELTELLYGSDGELVSQLDWEQKTLFNIGINSTITLKNFIISGSFDFSVPLGTSNMYDSDWEDGEKYSLTTHPIVNSKNISTDAALAYNIKATQKLTVIPEIQFNYLYSDFEAGIGSGYRYGRNIRVYGIDYNRHSYFIFTGLSIKTELTPEIFFKTGFFGAPWNYQKSFDYHHGVKHPFSSLDLQTGYFTKYKADFSIDFKIDKTLSLDLFTRLLFGFPDKGLLYSDYNTIEMEKITSQKSGAAIHSIKAGTSLIFIF